MDDATGHEVEGIDITNTDTAETLASVCGGVDFAHTGGGTNHYTSASGTGTDCTTSLPVDVQSGADDFAAGGGTIHVTEPPIGAFLVDTFIGASTDPLDGHVPDVGDPWDTPYDWELDGANQLYIPSGAGGANPYRPAVNTTTPPSADYSVQVDYDVPAGVQGFQLAGWAIRFVDTDNMLFFYYHEGTGEIHVLQRTAGIETEFDSFPCDYGTMTLSVVGTDLTFTEPDSTLHGPYTVTHLDTGNVAVFNFGDITHIVPLEGCFWANLSAF